MFKLKRYLRSATLLTLALVVSMSSANANSSYTKLTDERKSELLTKFKVAISELETHKRSKVNGVQISKKAAVAALAKSNHDKARYKPKNGSHHWELERLIDGDKYLVNLFFLKDKDWPTLYGGSTSFEENKSEHFYESTKQAILEEYLGLSYMDYEPTLKAVIDGVSIDVRITSADQLEELLKDERISEVEHLGEYAVTEWFH